ncbi:MAG: hypothetical protein U1F42_05955 [Candidatus Competibacteraceae bacterium]
MKEFIKIAVLAMLVVVLSPIAGYWITALIGAALFLLPVGVLVSMLFPKVWKQLEDSALAKVSF